MDAKRFKNQRNLVVSMIRKSKKNFFDRLNTKDDKLFWKTIKTLNGNTCSIPTLKENGRTFDKPIEKATALNIFFHYCFNLKCPPLEINDFADQFVDLDPSDCPKDLLCTEQEVGLYEYLVNLETGKSMGCDGISPNMLKSTAENSASPLAMLFNLSISTGNYPSAWKKARVVPVPKSGDPSLVNNYRPISILPVVSMTLEKHVKALLEEHMKLHSPISPRQWGFMSSRSTVSALIQVIDDWSRAVDGRYEVCIVFFDVKKAFDSVPHVALLKHLQYMHVNEYIVKWMKSYLLGREQFVGIDGCFSASLRVLSGVPQGSVLGPLYYSSLISTQ